MEYLEIARELLDHEIDWDAEIGPGGTTKQDEQQEPDRKQNQKKLVFPSITNLGEVEPEEVGFLWDPYMPLGKLTILEGDPGLGKTFLALKICTIIYKGWQLTGPDGKPGQPMEPGNILFDRGRWTG